MKCDNMIGSPDYTSLISACTDKDAYAASDTSIKLWINYGVPNAEGGLKTDFTAALEFWDGSNWMAVELQTGSITTVTSPSSTKTFSLTGKSAGSYRFKIYYSGKLLQGGTAINQTYAFVVAR